MDLKDGLRRPGSRPVLAGPRTIGVSLQPAIPRQVAPSRARFRFTGPRHDSSAAFLWGQYPGAISRPISHAVR